MCQTAINVNWRREMSNSHFTEDEQFLLMSVPAMIGSAVSMSEKSGVVGTVKEAMASARSLVGGIKQYPDNRVIQDILPAIAERKEALEQAKQYRQKAITRMQENGVNNPEKFKQQLLQDCREVSLILDNKASEQDKQEYKQWAMTLAEQVAMAAKEGGFLGFGGEQISPGEVQMISEIANAIGSESPLTVA